MQARSGLGFAAPALLAALVLLLGGCGSGSGNGNNGGGTPAATYDLSFSSTDFAPHDDQVLNLALVRTSDGAVVARDSALVTGGAFSFVFAGVLEAGESYDLDYHIDSNFGGGALGVCDPEANDHQWRLAIPAVAGDVALAETHRPGATSAVCASFPAQHLVFSGDDTFQSAHGGDPIEAAVIRAADGLMVGSLTGTVAASGAESFSFSFYGVLQPGVDYTVAYWIDSNFGGGSAGVCDPPANDHQWRVSPGDVGAGTVSHTETHDPGATQAACSLIPFDLTFDGSGYDPPHAGQAINVALVRQADGAVVAREAGRVDGSGNFSLALPNTLQDGYAYSLDYYIDSNISAGTPGVCDPEANDHQWRLDLGTVTADVAQADTHRPTATNPVCASFPTTATWNDVQSTIFTPVCTLCHDTGSPPQGLILDSANSPDVVNADSAEMPALKRVKPGEPDRSYLVWKIEGSGPDGEPIVGDRMPQGGPYLSGTEIQRVRDWIAEGAQVP